MERMSRIARRSLRCIMQPRANMIVCARKIAEARSATIGSRSPDAAVRRRRAVARGARRPRARVNPPPSAGAVTAPDRGRGARSAITEQEPPQDTAAEGAADEARGLDVARDRDADRQHRWA